MTQELQGIKLSNAKLKGEIVVPKRGIDGAIFTPKIDEEGNISWTNNGNLENPTAVNIKGPKGDPGAIKFIVVAELPETGTDDAIYLIPSCCPTATNAYDEYVYNNSEWEQIGQANVQVDLTNYVKNTDYATINKTGVVYANGLSGLEIDSAGGMYIKPTPKEAIDNGYLHFAVTTGNLDYATKVGITTNTIQLTPAEQAAAQKWLGVGGTITQIPVGADITAYELDTGLYYCPKGSLVRIKKNGPVVNADGEGGNGMYIAITQAVGDDWKTFFAFGMHAVGFSSIPNYHFIKWGWVKENVGNVFSIDLSQVSILNKAETYYSVKTFQQQPQMIAELAAGDNSTNIPNTAWVQGELELLRARIAELEEQLNKQS